MSDAGHLARDLLAGPTATICTREQPYQNSRNRIRAGIKRSCCRDGAPGSLANSGARLGAFELAVTAARSHRHGPKAADRFPGPGGPGLQRRPDCQPPVPPAKWRGRGRRGSQAPPCFKVQVVRSGCQPGHPGSRGRRAGPGTGMRPGAGLAGSGCRTLSETAHVGGAPFGLSSGKRTLSSSSTGGTRTLRLGHGAHTGKLRLLLKAPIDSGSARRCPTPSLRHAAHYPTD
jgi:hypothetical protein